MMLKTLMMKKAQVKLINLIESHETLKTDEIKMATKHSEWKLFPALNVFLWLSPKEFFSNENNQFISKEEQLYKLDLAINMLAKFAQTISHGN